MTEKENVNVMSVQINYEVSVMVDEQVMIANVMNVQINYEVFVMVDEQIMIVNVMNVQINYEVSVMVDDEMMDMKKRIEMKEYVEMVKRMSEKLVIIVQEICDGV
jgi:aspartate 1-decarboxylase